MAKRKEQFWVAVVDDDAGMREATQALLRSAGYRTSSFRSAEAFLRAAPARSAGCLVLDMRLPGINGLQLYSKLRDSGVVVPAILLTADSDRDGRLRALALAAGMLALLHKPFASDVLLDLVQQAWKQHRPK
jgi:FixJ family two-component response regulator